MKEFNLHYLAGERGSRDGREKREGGWLGLT